LALNYIGGSRWKSFVFLRITCAVRHIDFVCFHFAFTQEETNVNISKGLPYVRLVAGRHYETRYIFLCL